MKILIILIILLILYSDNFLINSSKENNLHNNLKLVIFPGLVIYQETYGVYLDF